MSTIELTGKIRGIRELQQLIFDLTRPIGGLGYLRVIVAGFENGQLAGKNHPWG